MKKVIYLTKRHTYAADVQKQIEYWFRLSNQTSNIAHLQMFREMHCMQSITFVSSLSQQK